MVTLFLNLDDDPIFLQFAKLHLSQCIRDRAQLEIDWACSVTNPDVHFIPLYILLKRRIPCLLRIRSKSSLPDVSLKPKALFQSILSVSNQLSSSKVSLPLLSATIIGKTHSSPLYQIFHLATHSQTFTRVGLKLHISILKWKRFKRLGVGVATHME